METSSNSGSLLHLPPEIPASVCVTRDLATPAPDREIRELTGAMTSGCETAWNGFYNTYHRRLKGYLVVCWKGESAAVDDLLQETLLRAVKHMRAFDSEEALWSWLTVLAKSAVVDHGRKVSRFRRFLRAFVPERIVKIPPDEVLKEASRKLSSENRQLLAWKYEEGSTVSEIAGLLEISEKAVESRLTRARAALKKNYRKLS